jgi:hypothetical protein
MIIFIKYIHWGSGKGAHDPAKVPLGKKGPFFEVVGSLLASPVYIFDKYGHPM